MDPATPQRPGPGAYIQTPAPGGRPGFFRTSSAQQQQVQRPPPGPVAPAPSLTPIERAARTVNRMLDKDASYRELEAYLGQGISGEYEIAPSIPWNPFLKLRTYQIPERILDEINDVQMATSMGLFAEINHAWVTIDNQLFMWDYTHPNPELEGFTRDDNRHTIVSVNLVKPRPNVFLDQISYLLVVATTADIFLLGVACERGPEGVHKLNMYQTNMSTKAPCIATSIVGSAKTGRIFFGDGRDSEDIYELKYQQQEKWFSAKCTSVNHTKKALGWPMIGWRSNPERVHITQLEIDDTRNVLYALSSNGDIRGFHMKTVTGLDEVLPLPKSTLMRNCSHIIRPTNTLGGNNDKVVRIDVVSAQEANQASLIATTGTGCRIFLSTTSGGYFNDPTAAPNSIQVRHIRFPPAENGSNSPGASTQLQPYQRSAQVGIDSSFLTTTEGARRYPPGAFFCFVRKTNDQMDHVLFMSTPHGGTSDSMDPTQMPRFKEDAQTLRLNGIMQDMGLVSAPFSANSGPKGFGNELAVQFDKPPSEYAIMTNNGIDIVRRRRLVDIFASIVKYGGGPDGLDGDVRKILNQYGRAETMATAIAVACGQGSDVGADSRVAQISDPEVLEYAKKVFVEMGGRAQLNENATVEGLNVDNVAPSPRHDGIALYISRLVRSVWQTTIVVETRRPNGISISGAHSVKKLQEVQRALLQLQEFLNANKQNIDGLAGPEALGMVSSRQNEIELQGENRALTSLVQLVNSIVEGIAFVLVLFDERVQEIVALLSPESQTKFRQLTYEGLVSAKDGRDLAKELVKAIVTRNIQKGSNVETIAEALRRKCGSFCSSDDVVIFKAQENLKRAADLGANTERGRVVLNQSLQLFEQVAKSLNDEHLTEAIGRYIELEFYAGAIKLALAVAQQLDRGNKALSWIRDERPAQDAREVYYKKRTFCYDLVFRVIDAVDRAYRIQPPAQDGIISPITRRRIEAYEQINDSQDEVFQYYLYDWYVQRDQADRLLDIQSSFVVEYLKRRAPTDIAHADLLWRYFAHYQDFWSAAEVQYELASGELDLSLDNRIDYLAKANTNASAPTRGLGFNDGSVRSRQSKQELLRKTRDLIDVANIQHEVLEKLSQDPRGSGDSHARHLRTLDGKIMPLDELYNQYIDQAGYYDLSIAVFHAADHRSLPDIRATWTNFVDQVHQTAVSEGNPQPWESVSFEVEKLGRRVEMNEHVFPVNVLLQILLTYDLEFYTHDTGNVRANPNLIHCANLEWPLVPFITLGAPFEHMIATFEALWYAQERPFQGRNMRVLAKWIIYTIEQWDKKSSSGGRGSVRFGGEENALGLLDFVRTVQNSGVLGQENAVEKDWTERTRVLFVELSAVVR